MVKSNKLLKLTYLIPVFFLASCGTKNIADTQIIKSYKMPKYMTVTITKDGKTEHYSRLANNWYKSDAYTVKNGKVYNGNHVYTDKETVADVKAQIDPKIKVSAYSYYLPGKTGLYSWNQVKLKQTGNIITGKAKGTRYKWVIKGQQVDSVTWTANGTKLCVKKL